VWVCGLEWISPQGLNSDLINMKWKMAMDDVGGKKLIKTSIGLKIKEEVKLDSISILQPTTHAFYSLMNMTGPQNIS
jgi:hypothetical protein